MESKPPTDNHPVHIINIDIQDNHEEATMGAFLICDLVATVRTYVPIFIQHLYEIIHYLNIFVIIFITANIY